MPTCKNVWCLRKHSKVYWVSDIAAIPPTEWECGNTTAACIKSLTLQQSLRASIHMVTMERKYSLSTRKKPSAEQNSEWVDICCHWQGTWENKADTSKLHTQLHTSLFRNFFSKPNKDSEESPGRTCLLFF